MSIFNDLVGLGGEMSKGRWHTPTEGKRIVYLSEHPALALIETLVNLKVKPGLGPEIFQLLRVESSRELTTERITEESLPTEWRDNPEFTQGLGNGWLERGQSALLAVPSAPSPQSVNYLLNPGHADAARMEIVWSRPFRYD